MRHVAVPLIWAHRGDVLERDPRGGPDAFAVVTQVITDHEGNVHVHSIGADGELNHDFCPLGSVPATFDRVGEDCMSTPEGLRAFIAEWLQLPPAP